MKEITMSGVHLDAMQAALLATDRGVGEGLDNQLHFSSAHRAADNAAIARYG